MGVHNVSTTYIIHGDCNDHKTIDADSFVVMNRLLFKERTNYAQDDYFARSSPLEADASDGSSSSSSNGTPVNPSCRYIMAKWCIGLCKYCGYDREMVASIMSCVDRFVATSEGSNVLRNRDRYQLAVMASLYLVSKVQQTQALEPESMAKLSRGKYTKVDVEAMELTILTELEWLIHPPTPIQFAREFVRHLDLGVLPCTGCFDSDNDDDDSSMETDGDPSGTSSPASSSSPLSKAATEQRILELVSVQIEEAICDYELGCVTPPSRVAFGALSNALQSLGVDPSSPESMRTLNKRLLQQTTKQSNNTMGAATITNVSAALLKVVSSSDSSNNSLTNLLIQKCCGRNNNNKNNQTEEQQQKQSASSSFTKTTSSACVHSSPRTIVNDGIGLIV